MCSKLGSIGVGGAGGVWVFAQHAPDPDPGDCGTHFHSWRHGRHATDGLLDQHVDLVRDDFGYWPGGG